MRLPALLLLLPLAAMLAAAPRTRVACVGNSITYGYLLPEREKYAYPSQLREMLGDKYEVGNFGHSGATLLRRGHRPYNTLPEYARALDFNPDIVVIHLGVNDTDPRDWPHYGDDFVGDYVALVNDFKKRNPDVRVILARLTPLKATHYRFETGTRDWRIEIQKAIDNVARATGAEVIDFDTLLRDKQDVLHDGIHPDAVGAWYLADCVNSAITGDYGGLALPDIWQDGMVVQRDRPVRLHGTANAGAAVSATLDGRTARTRTDNRGNWSLTLPPLVVGDPYTLTVTDGDTTICVRDILAGEVWLASGQSNMEYPLGRDPKPDPLLRVYDMRPVARTDKALWSDTVQAYVDELDYFTETPWEQPDRGFSAVAYHFARQLRDSLNVPVGIISNPVGGSPTEAWIDVNTLEKHMPGILRDWRRNDYLQPWVQERITDNIGDAYGRHPYEPSYLFSAGIRPLGSPGLAGVIWYQGESNAHNTELHERLFPLLLQSWRGEFRNDTLPFIFAQLSSIDRPSWPHFRDSQRRLAESLPRTWMAVTSDVGDSLDVHPTRKKPVGRRMARIALSRIYGHDSLVYQGPSVISATAAPGTVTLHMRNARGLTTSDGLAPRVFEIAETDGIFFPAEAIINGDKIILTNMQVTQPRYVRYGWQPFTRSNVINADSLPMSTFRMETGNAADFDIEPGYEYGVSAPFFGLLDGTPVIAGGANFPCDEPLAPDARKATYKGIYAADPTTMEWRRIGLLPQPAAYGASATTPDGILFIGTDRNTWLLTSEGLKPMASSPVALDNAAAAAIGDKVYVAGGNADGSPSRDLYLFDINKNKWKKLCAMPGNARVQPVMAASGNNLYIWGGFAPASGSNPPTVETGGLVYNTSSKKWDTLTAPADADGNPLTLTGGSAVTLPDGRIFTTGGVNYDVFLDAITALPSGYLLHPIDWYRFNGNINLFDPKTGTWQHTGYNPDAARAGAAIFSTPGKGVLIYGGELKPRIRTASTLSISLD